MRAGMKDPSNYSLSIVTSLYGDYGRFLPDWAESICALLNHAKYLTEVIVVISGPAGDAETVFIKKCVPLFNAAGISYKLIILPTHISMGFARNAAVRQVSSEWVQYLDVDDTILPHALDDWAAKVWKGEESGLPVDVVCVGVRYGADKTGTPDRLFLDASAKKALEGEIISFSHSFFRKKLWEKQPYIETNDMIDSALWVGFAHQGARFTATDRVGTVYHKRLNGHNLSGKKKSKKKYPGKTSPAWKQLLALCADKRLFNTLYIEEEKGGCKK